MGIDAQAVLAAEQIVAQQAFFFHLGNARIQVCCQLPELTAQVHIGRVRAYGIRTQGNPFQELEGVAFHDLAVFEGAWL